MIRKLRKNKLSQEEIVGFVLIMIIVAVILLIFLFIYLNKPKSEVGGESEEIHRFLLALLPYTTSCEDYEGHLTSINELTRICEQEGRCLDGRNSCDVLESDLKNITSISFPVGGDRPVKGFEFTLSYVNHNLTFSSGNKTGSYAGSKERVSEESKISLKLYT